jgi:hypothetical protein
MYLGDINLAQNEEKNPLDIGFCFYIYMFHPFGLQCYMDKHNAQCQRDLALTNNYGNAVACFCLDQKMSEEEKIPLKLKLSEKLI